jgi:hypothetical protein
VVGEGSAVLGGGIALVGGEAVLGVEEVEVSHEGVAVDFGDDGGGGDGEGERVAVEEAGLGAGVGYLGEVEEHGVDEEVVGGEGEALDGEEHGEAGGLVDVEAVDGGGVDFGDGEGEGVLADLAVEELALVLGELLGVFEAEAGEGGGARGEDDGGGDDGAEEGSSTDFVDTGDEGEAVVAEGLLGGVGADELLEHLLLGGGPGDASGGGNGEERGHCRRAPVADSSVADAVVDEFLENWEGRTGAGFDEVKQRREVRSGEGMGGIRSVTGRLALRSYLSYAC